MSDAPLRKIIGWPANPNGSDVMLRMLERDILVAGNMYQGDLMSNCYRIPAEYWSRFPEQWDDLNYVVEKAVSALNRDRSVFLNHNPYGANL